MCNVCKNPDRFCPILMSCRSRVESASPTSLFETVAKSNVRVNYKDLVDISDVLEECEMFVADDYDVDV